jgi:lysophospholipase L1-like esterase
MQRIKIITAVLTLLLFQAATMWAADPTTKPANAPLEPAGRPGAIKVACVGDSITYGAGVKDRSHESYPAQLAKLLGDKYDTRNFGVSGTTLLSKGDRPYIKQKRYQAALSYAPDIVIIALGTNDTKPQNWSHKDDFVGDYKALISSFKDANPAVKTYVCIPVPAFPGFLGINEKDLSEGVIPATREVAADEKLPVIDLHEALAGKAELFPDTVHPNAQGAALMAAAVAKGLGVEVSSATTVPSSQPTP